MTTCAETIVHAATRAFVQNGDATAFTHAGTQHRTARQMIVKVIAATNRHQTLSHPVLELSLVFARSSLHAIHRLPKRCGDTLERAQMSSRLGAPLRDLRVANI